MIDRAGREREREAREFLALLAAKAHRRRGAERDADNMLEHRPVAMPPDPGTRAVGDEQRLRDGIARDIREVRGAVGDRAQPFWQRLGPAEGARPEIIMPARSEERRVGKAGGSTCRTRWSA